MRLGKLSGDQLKHLVLDRFHSAGSDVVVGAEAGEDCCVVRGGDLLALTTDPITAADIDSGFLAVHVNANDVAAAGAQPFACLATLLLSPETSEEECRRILDELDQAARSLDVEIIGGHTEVTDAVHRSVLSVTMLGRPVVPGKIVRSSGLSPGDTLVMTKYAGIEGTLILAREHENELAGVLTAEDRDQLGLLRGFMSVVPEGMIGAQDPYVTAMHDVTEGGIIGAVHEMSTASGTGAEIDLARIPYLPVTRKICEYFRIDPARLISSGSMLIGVDEQSRVMQTLGEEGIAATVIGSATAEAGVRSRADGKLLDEIAADEVYRAGRSANKV